MQQRKTYLDFLQELVQVFRLVFDGPTSATFLAVVGSIVPVKHALPGTVLAGDGDRLALDNARVEWQAKRLGDLRQE
jgi:hypothetical protein